MNQFRCQRLVEAVDRFGERIVVAVAPATNGGFNAGLAQTLGISNADILRAPIAMMSECRAFQSRRPDDPVMTVTLGAQRRKLVGYVPD